MHPDQMQLASLGKLIDPSRTVLLLGAGASVPAGGLTGVQMARELCEQVSSGEIESDNLAEAASLLEHQYGRLPLVESLRSLVLPLQPDGGLLGLSDLPWARIYTTNYDQLIEKSFRALNRPLAVIKTNRDFTKLDKTETELLKIHGCISQDRSLGHTDSMVLTERDYSEFESYRESLFQKLAFDLHTKDVLIIGQSLGDPHLRSLIDMVAKRAKQQNSPNRIFTLLFAADEARISLLEERNIRATMGSLSALLESIEEAPVQIPASGQTTILPRQLLHRTVSVSQAGSAKPDASRLFNGGSATFADIKSGLTFERSGEDLAVDQLKAGEIQYLTILGASGTGKSTFGRRILSRLEDSSYTAFEHKPEFDLDAQAWSDVAIRAKSDGQSIVLLVDDAAGHLNAINRLVRSLEDHDNSSLRIILTANANQWSTRSRSPQLKRFGRDQTLSTLTGRDVEKLVELCRAEKSIRELIQPKFAALSKADQISAVIDVCSADMFVALKYCFPGQEVDRIILEEFAELPELSGEVYKCVALLQASHGTPSRQIVMDVLGVTWAEIDTVLGTTQGILNQKLVDRRDGLYSWSTRHKVIAEIIAFYKFDDQVELTYFLNKTIMSLNAAMLLDRHLVPALCDNTYAIGRVEDPDERVRLFQLLAERSNNRVPWHRLISAWLHRGDISKTAQAIAKAEKAVGIDSPIHRYKVLLELRKAESLRSLGTGDYIALLNGARREAEWGIEKWPQNKYSYRVYADVARELHKATGNYQPMDNAASWMREAYEEILDDDLLRWANNIPEINPLILDIDLLAAP